VKHRHNIQKKNMSPSASATGAGQSKVKGKNKGEGGKKVGNPGNFHGARLDFLEAQLPIYLSKKGRGEVIDFFDKVLNLWWAKFPWYEGHGPDGNALPKATATGSGTTHNDAPGSGNDGPESGTTRDDTLGSGTMSSDAPWASTGGVDPAFKEKIMTEVNGVRTPLNKSKILLSRVAWPT
jgi:hypothetical protein